MSVNRVLREVVGPKREEVAGGCRRLRNEELRNLYATSNIVTVIKSRRMRWAEHIARTAWMRNVYNIFIPKPERQSPLRRPACR
jgi:hypothetical protein